MDVFQGNKPLKFMSHVNRKSSPPFPFIGSFYNNHKILCLEFRAQQGREEKARTETPESNKREVFGNLLILKLMTNVQCFLAGVTLPPSDLVTCLWSQGFRDSQIRFLEVFPKLPWSFKKKKKGEGGGRGRGEGEEEKKVRATLRALAFEESLGHS